MEIFFAGLLTVLGLSLFETISSIDNAIINGEVLGTMSPRARRWFLLWGIIIAVFLVRGLLPLIILWVSNPALGLVGAFTASFSNNDPTVVAAMEVAKPILLVGGGVFLILLFLHWLFIEDKAFSIPGERFIRRHGGWFYAVSSVFLAGLVWVAVKHNAMMAVSATIGSTAFFVTHGFKENADRLEKEMLHGTHPMSDLSKLLYLEVIDATFSIDGVLGAFAFTMSVPLILLGNGVGAVVVRQLTLANIENVKKYKYLKNGAMYSIGVLGIVMVADSFDVHIPSWVSPVATFGIDGYFFWLSVREIKRTAAAK